ncbi:MAG: hypothetical protein J6J81_07040 [Oscillospiraceae bacterium]|nr:hypothetical protein [Oscillospiraceae bacterium]
MYNRYIRNDTGSYARIPEEEPSPRQAAPPKQPPPKPDPPPKQPPPRQETPPPRREAPPPRQERSDVLARALRGLLDRLHLESVDTGDLLLLVLLFLLYEEHADEELLFALGILLIL